MKKMFLLAACTALLAGGVAFANHISSDLTFKITDTNETGVPRARALEICPGTEGPTCATGEQTSEILYYPD